MIPQQRIAEKLDEHMSRRDYAGAERHLLYWLDEAKAIHDMRGELMVSNELVGHFRKTGNREQAFIHAAHALNLLEKTGFEGTISAGTTYTNVATAYNAFGRNEESLELFQKAAQVYEASPHTAPHLLGGLYNNMALTCTSLMRFDEAEAYYRKALEKMGAVENGELEQAITYLNMADAAVAKATAQGGVNPLESGDEVCEREVERCLDTALNLLNTPGIPHDGYYAFVCEKCAPVFAHYGYFLADEDLRNRAEAIYERA
ncbi:MAG: tetratricopeptide repeat protein [Coriobacteriia bacterium]|nr:tetratricopeptide repeat protein [Coriobacteriia bacterium]